MSYELPTPQAILTAAVRSVDKPANLNSALQNVPLMRDACLAMATYICDVVPTIDGEEPLAHAAMKNAWRHYQSVGGGQKQHVARVRAFTAGMLFTLGDIAHTRIYTVNGGRISHWDPGPVTLYDWLRARAGQTPRVAHERWLELDAETAIALVAARVLPWPHVAALGGSLRAIVDDAVVLGAKK